MGTHTPLDRRAEPGQAIATHRVLLIEDDGIDAEVVQRALREFELSRFRLTHATTMGEGIDPDGFKAVNDSLGHESGDTVLKTVAGRLRASMRASDTVPRLGDDEFIVLVDDLHDADAATTLAMERKVIAEGVETREQLQILHDSGCDQAQGFYFSTPVPAEALPALLARDLRAGLGPVPCDAEPDR